MPKKAKMVRADELQTGDIHAVLGTVDHIRVKRDEECVWQTGITWSALTPHISWHYGGEVYRVRGGDGFQG